MKTRKPINLVKLESMTEAEALALVCSGMGAIKGVDRFDRRLEHFSDSYRVNVIRGLRIDRDRWTVRDNGIGMRSQPVNLADWPKCTIDDARFALAREVWCDAVRVSNGGRL